MIEQLIQYLGTMSPTQWLHVLVLVVILFALTKLLTLAHWKALGAHNDYIRDVALDLVRAAQQMFEDFSDPLLGKKKREWVINEARKRFRIELTDKEIEAAVFIVKQLEQRLFKSTPSIGPNIDYGV